MKTLAPTLTLSLAFYGALIILISSFTMAYETALDAPAKADINQKEIVLDFEDEDYINDIPFDTKTIAKKYFLEINNRKQPLNNN